LPKAQKTAGCLLIDRVLSTALPKKGRKKAVSEVILGQLFYAGFCLELQSSKKELATYCNVARFIAFGGVRIYNNIA
jgi:hypothetical protein